MLRRALAMASANSRGRAPQSHDVPIVKGGHGRHQTSAVQSKPPTGRLVRGSQSERSLVSGLISLTLQESVKSSASSVTQIRRRSHSASHRPLNIKNIEDIAILLREELVRNIVIVAGAGISTPSGIPDFRSPGTGLYDNLQQYNIPYAEAIFDIDYFHHNPRPFFALAKELYPCGKYRPNYLHYFAKLLYDRGLLLRIYTQNIDGLERIAGIPPDRIVEAHGTFSSATCTTCRHRYDGEEIKEKIFQDKLPRCKKMNCTGIIKPDIVFFGEELPKRFYFYLKDMLQTDLVLILGTSLEVQPFAGIIDTVRFTVPRVLFNREAVGPFRRQMRSKDFIAEGDLLEQVQQFVMAVGWSQDMMDLITHREGMFRMAFPPPVTESDQASDKKAVKSVKSDSLAAMWRQNAQINYYSDSDTSDTDSGVTPSESESESSSSSSDQEEEDESQAGGSGVVGGRVDSKVKGKSNSSSTVSSGCGSNSSSSSSGGSNGGGTGSVLGKPSGNGMKGNGRPGSRSLSQLAANRTQGIAGKKGSCSHLFRSGVNCKTAWTGKEGSKPPPAPANHRKLSLAIVSKVRQSRQSTAPPPGSHPAKPRSQSVTKAIPKKLHSMASKNLQSLFSRTKSAQSVNLVNRRCMQPVVYSAHLLAMSQYESDSSLSEDIDDEADDSDESSDDS